MWLALGDILRDAEFQKPYMKCHKAGRTKKWKWGPYLFHLSLMQAVPSHDTTEGGVSKGWWVKCSQRQRIWFKALAGRKEKDRVMRVTDDRHAAVAFVSRLQSRGLLELGKQWDDKQNCQVLLFTCLCAQPWPLHLDPYCCTGPAA